MWIWMITSIGDWSPCAWKSWKKRRINPGSSIIAKYMKSHDRYWHTNICGNNQWRELLPWQYSETPRHIVICGHCNISTEVTGFNMIPADLIMFLWQHIMSDEIQIFKECNCLELFALWDRNDKAVRTDSNSRGVSLITRQYPHGSFLVLSGKYSYIRKNLPQIFYQFDDT
jgi:hypothetical protein